MTNSCDKRLPVTTKKQKGKEKVKEMKNIIIQTLCFKDHLRTPSLSFAVIGSSKTYIFDTLEWKCPCMSELEIFVSAELR